MLRVTRVTAMLRVTRPTHVECTPAGAWGHGCAGGVMVTHVECSPAEAWGQRHVAHSKRSYIVVDGGDARHRIRRGHGYAGGVTDTHARHMVRWGMVMQEGSWLCMLGT